MTSEQNLSSKNPLNACQVFHGAASAAEARVYARLPLAALPAEWRHLQANTATRLKLAGKVTGPTCAYAKTLDFSVPVVDRGPGETLLAEAIVPDPCFWTPDLPFLYRVEIELKSGNELLAKFQTEFGIRTLGVRARQLLWEGKNWVLRGVDRNLVSQAPLEEWRDSLVVMLGASAEEEHLAAASRAGVMLAVNAVAQPNLTELLWRCSRSPAVVMAFVDDSIEAIDPRALPPNLLLANPSFSNGLPNSVDLFIDGPESKMARSPDFNRPPMVLRLSSEHAPTLAAARAQCDQLQRDMAGIVDWSGYLLM